MEDKSIEGYRKAVDKGITFLDKEEPGWREKVDVNKLNMGSCDRCVLGQIYGDFIDGAMILFTGQRDNIRAILEHGFDVQYKKEHKLLQQAWEERLT